MKETNYYHNQEIENILYSCSDLYKENVREKLNLEKLQTEAENFFQKTQNQIDPKLDSIVNGLERKQFHLKWPQKFSIKKSKNPLSFL